nr:MAG TPA: hypothetical protein [Caudoviricetes sp.]
MNTMLTITIKVNAPALKAQGIEEQIATEVA